MKKPETLKVLAIELEKGLRQKTRGFLHGKTLQIDFSDQSSLKKVPKRELRRYEALCFITKIYSEPLITLQSFSERIGPKAESKKK